MGTEFTGSGLTLGQANALVKKLGGIENVRLILAGRVKVVVEKVAEELFRLVTSVKFTGRDTDFDLANEFAVGNYSDGLNVAYQSALFKAWFGNKVEGPTGESELAIRKLVKAAFDTEIAEGLGGEVESEISMAEFHSLLLRQGNGKNGEPLLTNGCANIAYCRDVNGVLRAVSAHWRDGGWCFYADPTNRGNRWEAGLHVVSRK